MGDPVPSKRYGISLVRTDAKKDHITFAMVHERHGETFSGRGHWWARDLVVDSMRQGQTFVTLLIGTTGWQIGTEVHLIEVEGVHFLRTDSGTIAQDDFGDRWDLTPEPKRRRRSSTHSG